MEMTHFLLETTRNLLKMTRNALRKGRNALGKWRTEPVFPPTAWVFPRPAIAFKTGRHCICGVGHDPRAEMSPKNFKCLFQGVGVTVTLSNVEVFNSVLFAELTAKPTHAFVDMVIV